jgi:hypothetical protein
MHEGIAKFQTVSCSALTVPLKEPCRDCTDRETDSKVVRSMVHLQSQVARCATCLLCIARIVSVKIVRDMSLDPGLL